MCISPELAPPVSGAQWQAKLTGTEVTKVGSVTPVEDFKAMLRAGDAEVGAVGLNLLCALCSVLWLCTGVPR